MMRGFNVLDTERPLSTTFLEASAGTGKTFTIENLIVRLLLDEKGPLLSEILVLTFTKAATLELKQRIYTAIAKEKKLKRALSLFDEASIFTIHSFCFHALQENALEAGLSLEQKEENAPLKSAKLLVKDYLQGISHIHPFELEKLIKGPFIDDILKLSSKRVPVEGGRSFKEICEEFKKTLLTFDVSSSAVLHDLLLFAPCFSGMSKLKPELVSDLEKFARLFDKPFTENDFPFETPLLAMRDETRLKTAKWPTSSQEQVPGTFLRIQKHLVPLIKEANNKEAILGNLTTHFQNKMGRVIEKEELFFYEDLLCVMEKKVQEDKFAANVRSQYKAVFVDEFQDTDSRQWNILNTLFGRESFKGLLYLIGDPKQSIYRFRNSDLYTYLNAKKTFQENEVFSLDTNFRATPSLVQGLNFLFSNIQDFLTLPKTSEAFPCPPVKAKEPLIEEKKAVHFFEGENEAALFSFILQKCQNYKLQTCAILVKDRFQGQRFLQYCKERDFPAVAKRCRTIHDTPSLAILYEFLDAVIHPKERSKIAIALGGNIFGWDHRAIQNIDEQTLLRFQNLHHLLLEKGILPLLKEIECEKELYSDLMQIGSEMAFHVESIDGYLPYIKELMKEPEDSEAAKLYFVESEEALQVLTIHASKGLEYEVIFPIGLILETSPKKEFVYDSDKNVLTQSEEAFSLHLKELEAEKMRLLYVAMTRAKEHLYLPVLPAKYPNSPMNLFLKKRIREESLEDFVKSCSVMSYSHCKEEAIFWKKEVKENEKCASKTFRFSFKPEMIHSFSSLVQHREEVYKPKTGSLPSGPIFGEFIHTLLEKTFPSHLDKLPEFLEKSPYAEWKEGILEMVLKSLHMPLSPSTPFTLASLDPSKVIHEMEFLYSKEGNFLKGFIDLVFEKDNKIYFLDWKTNDLGNDYSKKALENAMEENFYLTQGKIYQEAVLRYLTLLGSKYEFGGFFYLFMRGPGVLLFNNLLDQK